MMKLLPPVDEPEGLSEALPAALDTALMDIYDWYGSVLPSSLHAWSFPRFVARSREFAQRVVDGVRDDLPMEIAAFATTAYTDGQTVTLPALYMVSELYDYFGIPAEHHVAASCLMFNGAQVHEALHCLVTPFGMEEFCHQAGNARALELLKLYRGFATVLNIVEDEYIEEYARRNLGGLALFCDGKNHVVLGERALDLAIAVTTAIPEGAETYPPPTVDQRLGLLTFSKTEGVRDDPRLREFVGRQLDLVVRARDLRKDQFSLRPGIIWEWGLPVSARVLIAVDVFESLLEEMDPGDKSNALRPIPDRSSLSTHVDLDELLDALVRGIAVDEETLLRAQVDLERAIEEELAEESPSEVDPTRWTDDQLRIGRDVAKHVPPLVTKDILSAMSRYDAVTESSPDWQRFGTYLRYQRQQKTVLGLATDRGTTVVKSRLARILTDGKVLANRDTHRVVRGRPKIMLLLDASGSMRHHVGGRYETLFGHCVNAALGMFEALMRASVPVAVYAHTSTGRDDLRPLLYKVAAFRMPMQTAEAISHGNYLERFKRLATVETVENFDGIAITACATQFPSDPGTKVLVVLSDGAPAGGGLYGGTPAQQHTAGAILDARRRGVHVLSVSLVDSVVATNDALYGRENNLRGFGEHLDTTLRELAAQLTVPAE